MSLDTIKARMRRTYGPGAQTEELEGILVVHLDKPDEAERARRRKEILTGGLVEDDCPLCKELAKTRPSVVVYDTDSVLCFGQEGPRPYASGFPRTRRTGAAA